MFIQDFYLGLDGKQRIVVLSAAGVSGLFLLCCVLWIFSGGQTATNLSDQQRIAITSGETGADRSQKTAAAAALAAPTPCLLYTSPSPRDGLLARMPSSA